MLEQLQEHCHRQHMLLRISHTAGHSLHTTFNPLCILCPFSDNRALPGYLEHQKLQFTALAFLTSAVTTGIIFAFCHRYFANKNNPEYQKHNKYCYWAGVIIGGLGGGVLADRFL